MRKASENEIVYYNITKVESEGFVTNVRCMVEFTLQWFKWKTRLNKNKEKVDIACFHYQFETIEQKY